MVCKKCYYNNEENAKFCVKCGEKLEPEVKEQITQSNNTQTNNTQSNVQSNNYVQYDETINYSPAGAIAALIVSILCCSSIPGIIFAILALVEGGKIKPAKNQGNIQVAKLNFENYKKWTKYAWISTVIWNVGIILIYILYFAFMFGIIFISEM